MICSALLLPSLLCAAAGAVESSPPGPRVCSPVETVLISEAASEDEAIVLLETGAAEVQLPSVVDAGLEQLYGTSLPASWEHFPDLSAAPLAEGPALLELRFRPFTSLTATVSLRGPETIRFFCQGLRLTPSLASGQLQCNARNSSLEVSADMGEEFSAAETYLLQVEVLHLPGSWRPDEDQPEVTLRPIRGTPGASWWLSFDDAAGRSLAFSETLPGYPVWPMALDVALDFVSVPLAPLPPGSASILALTFRIPEAPLGSLSSAVLRLYAPLGYSFNCSLQAPHALLALPAEESLPVANASCEAAAGSDVQARLVMQLAAASAVLEADVNYSFRVAVEIPAVLTTASEEATRWYFSLQAADTALGGPATQPWGLQELALSLSVPSASPGSAAPLQTALKLNQLLSSPKEGSVLACIELVAGEGYAFTSTCTVGDGIAPGAEAGQNPPAGCSCGVSAGVASICLPNGGYLLADVWYHFVLNSVLLPAGLGRRLTSSSGWSARAVTARGREVSRYLPGASTAAELNSVPRLEIFAFTSAAAAAETRRLGAVYVAAFSFKAAETTASAAARLLLTAPAGLQFMADTDCSPDSSAALLPLPSASEAAFSGGRVLPVGWCTATRRTSRQTLLLASDLPAVQSAAFPSALINLAKPLVDYRFRYLFRVAVQHPMVQPSYGIHVWVLSLLDDNWNMVAQRGDLGAYALVGELTLSVETTSLLLSSPGRPEEGNLTVHFQLSLAVEGGDLLFRLASGFRFPLLRHFSAPGSSAPAGENATTTATTTTATHTGEPEVRCSVYPAPGLVVLTATCEPQAGELRLTTERLQAGTSYSFQLEVANPMEVNNTQPFEFQSFNAGELLDAGTAPSFVFATGRLPFLALRTEPARPLADRTAAVLVIFASDTPLLASTELRLRPPSAFLLPSNSTCEHFEAANEEGRSALPTALLAALPRAWAEVQDAAPWPQMAIPLPPLAGCSLASTPGGGPEIRITLPGALKGQRSYAFAVTAQSPVVEPPSEQNIWHLEVWVQSVAAQRLLYVGDGQGFPLVPKLQEATVYPFRALGDAYLTQSFLLPRGASLVSLRVEFAIPFVSPGSLGQRLEVAVEAPEGFSLGSGRSCEVRSLQLGRDVVPESWYDCSAPSPLNLLLSSRVPPPAELEGIGNQLTYKAEIFPALPPVDAEGAENRLWNLRAFACTTSLDPLQEESDAATGSQDSSLCALLAASTGIPSWTMSGYLHVDQLIVEEADSMDQGSAAGQWLQQHTPSSATSQLLHLTIRGIRLNSALPAGSELRLLAPPGQSFLQPFDASMVRASGLPALDLSRCRTEEQLMVLSFQGDLSGDDGALDLSVVAQALGPTAESRDTEPWRLETRSVTGRVLGVQGNLGGFDRPSPFHFLVVTGATAAPAGGVFDLAVFFAVPEAFTLPGGSLLRLRSPLGVAFATGVSGLQLPAGAAGRLRDPRLLSVRPMPSSSYLASEDTLTITLGLEGLMQGASYAFQWPAQRRVGQEAAWQPSGVAGATGPFAELLLADEAASASRLGTWSLEALRAGRRLLKSEVFATELEMKSLSPVWLLPMRPFYGQESLVFVIFSLRGFAYAPTSRLRVKLTPGGGTERLRFLSCERQEALFRQGAWAQPLTFGTEAFVASEVVSPPSALVPVAFDNCVLGGQGTSAPDANESSMPSFEELQSRWRSTTGDDGHMGLWHGATGQFLTLTGSTVSAASCQDSGACGAKLLAEEDEVSCNFESDWCKWSNVGAVDWRRHKGRTSSSSTGPSEALEGSYYIYTETSRPNYPSKEFVLESGVLGLSAATNISFYYHMYGSSMGSFALEYQEGAAWTAALSLSGDQGNEWFHALLTLPASATKLRLKVVSGRSYRGDVAVDNITLIPLDTASARDSMVMTAEQTFVAQTLGHEFVFHSGGTACRTVFFDATDGNCQQRCGETLNCRFYTTWSDARCQMAETCDAVSEPRALTFQKARSRQRAVQALQVTSAEGEEAAVVNSSGQAELQDLSHSSSFEMPELADADIFGPNASMLQSLRDSSASARRRSSYVVMNYHQWGSNQEPNGIWNPYKHAKNEFHNYCGSKGEPVTLGQLYNDVSVTCSGSYGGHENCGYATCAEGEVIEQIAFGTTAASTWSPVLTLRCRAICGIKLEHGCYWTAGSHQTASGFWTKEWKNGRQWEGPAVEGPAWVYMDVNWWGWATDPRREPLLVHHQSDRVLTGMAYFRKEGWMLRWCKTGPVKFDKSTNFPWQSEINKDPNIDQPRLPVTNWMVYQRVESGRPFWDHQFAHPVSFPYQQQRLFCTETPVFGPGCSACEAGTVPVTPGSDQCVACGTGLYTDRKGWPSCKVCQVGYETRRRRAQSCEPCAAGKYQDAFLVAKGLSCKSCPAGHFSDAGAAVCTACSSGKFAANPGQSECETCSPGTQSYPAATACFSDCPCSQLFNCSCSFGQQLSYNVTVPVAPKGTQYKVRMKFIGDKISSCRLMDKPVTDLNMNSSCDEAMDATGSNYSGCQDRTTSGRLCLAWSARLTELEERMGRVLNQSERMDAGIESSSFCRNPDNSSTIWCYVQDDEVAWEYCQPKVERVFETTMRLLGLGSATIRLSGDRETCRGLQEFAVLHPMKATWGTCRSSASRDTWRILPVAASPGRVLLQFTGNARHLCAGQDGQMLDCYEHDLNQLVPMESLHESISQWTMKEHGNVEHRCGIEDHSTCSPVTASSNGNPLKLLVSMGKVGDPVGQHFLSKVQLKNTSVPGQFRYSYWMASGVFDSASCYDLQTDCVQATDSELYQLEAHRVQCGRGQALQSVAFQTCPQGYQYAYRCCDLHGMGGCDLELTPWTKREPSVQGRIEALAKHVLSCKDSWVLSHFVLEAKDPGESNSEVRFLYTCCEIAPHEPLSIIGEKSPLPLSYANFEGFYFPTSRVEGRLLYHMDHAFDRQAAAAVRNFSFDPHHGHWCLFLENASCVQQGTPHPLQLISSAEDLFEVTAMGPMKSKQEPGAPMKELKIVKFKLPPRMTQRKLEKLELEDEAMNHFQPSRELAGYDLNMVENWMPSTPNYRPYCALRDPKQWETLDDLKKEEESDWGVDKRNRLEELNLMENFMRTTEVSSTEHPCFHYFHDLAGIDNELYKTDFDVSRLLKFDELQSFASPMRKTSTRIRESRREQRKREDKKSEKSKSKMDNMMKKDEGSPSPSPTPSGSASLAPAPASSGKAKKKDKWEANDVYEGVDQDIETADQVEKGETWAKASGNANSFLSHPERPDPQLFGAVPEAMEKCAERQEIRAQKLAEQEVKHEVKQNYLDLTTTGILAICGVIPDFGKLAAPLGLGVDFSTRFGDICSLIVEFLSETTSFGFSQYWSAQQRYYGENEAYDTCSDYTDGQMFKTFCDMHCIEDAVLKGNSAILKSLKTQETHVVTTLHDMLKWYTTELFDKLKETQDQSSQNFLEQERVLKAYFEQMADMETGYANQVNTQIDQLGVDINSRFKNNVDHLNVLQKHLKTVNDNIISLANWLGNQPMFATDDDHTFTPPHSVLQGADPSRIGDAKGISVQKPPHVEAQENFGAAQMALADLLAQIHQAYSVDSASDEEQIVPLLSGLQAELHQLRHKLLPSPQAAVNASRGVVQALRQATTGLRALPRQGVEATFQRRSQVALKPAVRRWQKQALVVAGISSSLSQFGMSPSFTGVNQDSQQDRRYDYQKLMTSIHRDVSEYIQKAKVHVNAHKGTLLQLLSANATQSCKSSIVETGRLVAEMQRTEEDHVLSLLRTWKTLAENLDSLANLLVEGELLHSELHRSAVLDDSATEGLLAAAGDSGSLDLAAYLSLIEESLARSLSSNLLPFMKQLSQAFDLSQFLADMWVFGSFDVPETELTLVQTAWSRATKTAHGLLAQNSSMLPFRLLRLAVERAEEAMATNLFMAPDICTSGMQLWNMTSGHALVFDDKGRFYECDLKSGHLSPRRHRYQSTAINAAFSSLLQQLNMRMS